MNRVTLMGRIGQDPARKMDNLVTFSVATTYKDQTDWHQCSVWGKSADVVESYFKKGDMICVEGRISYRKTEDGKTFTNINVERVHFTGGNKERSNDSKPADYDPEPF